MEESNRSKSNPLQKKIDQGIRRNGFDDNFIAAIKFHLQRMSTAEIFKDNADRWNLKSEDDLCSLLISKLFIDKMDFYPTKRFKCQINECSAWPVPLLPTEIFGRNRLPSDYRKRVFYKCLQVGDILDCRVTSILPDKYQLRVIHKYGVTRILDDLKLIVVMPRNKSDLSPLQKDFLICELIRVSVSEITEYENETKVSVTVSDNNGELRQCRPQLGRISEEHLPAYVLDPPEPEPRSTYSDYLYSLPAFWNPILINSIFEGFGIDPRGDYSFFRSNERLKPVNGNTLLKESKMIDVKHYTDSALLDFESGDIQSALKKVDHAINIYPQKNQNRSDKVELSKLYEIRGRMYAETEKPKMVKNSLRDWKLAYYTDQNNESVKKSLSKAIFQASYKLYRDKQYKKVVEWTEKALKLDKNNNKAKALLEYLQGKHPELFINLDEVSLLTLQEKKKQLVTKLKSLCSPMKVKGDNTTNADGM